MTNSYDDLTNPATGWADESKTFSIISELIENIPTKCCVNIYLVEKYRDKSGWREDTSDISDSCEVAHLADLKTCSNRHRWPTVSVIIDGDDIDRKAFFSEWDFMREDLINAYGSFVWFD